MSNESGDKLATLKEIREFFDMSVPAMRNEWTQGGMTDEDKAQLRAGIGNGTLTY